MIYSDYLIMLDNFELSDVKDILTFRRDLDKLLLTLDEDEDHIQILFSGMIDDVFTIDCILKSGYRNNQENYFKVIATPKFNKVMSDFKNILTDAKQRKALANCYVFILKALLYEKDCNESVANIILSDSFKAVSESAEGVGIDIFSELVKYATFVSNPFTVNDMLKVYQTDANTIKYLLQDSKDSVAREIKNHFATVTDDVLSEYIFKEMYKSLMRSENIENTKQQIEECIACCSNFNLTMHDLKYIYELIDYKERVIDFETSSKQSNQGTEED